MGHERRTIKKSDVLYKNAMIKFFALHINFDINLKIKTIS